MDKFWLQLPVWQQQNVTVTWIEFERLQCSQVTYKYIWKPFSKAFVPKKRNKAGKAIMRAHKICNTLFNLSSTDPANSGHTRSSRTWFNFPTTRGNLQGAAAHKTHTQSISDIPIQQKANATASQCITMAAEGGSALSCSTSK